MRRRPPMRRLRTRLLVVANLCLVPAVLCAAEPPRSVTAAYALLAKHKHVPDVLVAKGGEWIVRASDAVEALSEPTVDVANGYVRIALRDDGCSESETEVALFVARDGRRFAAVGTNETCIDSDHASANFFAFDGAMPVDATSKAGAFGALSMQAFLDDEYLRDEEAQDTVSRVAYVALMAYRLPRVGTTVRVELRMPGSPATGYPENEYREARQIVDEHRKYEAIELKWSASEARFEIGRKVPK